VNCAFPECSLPAHPGIVVTYEESGSIKRKRFCSHVHAAQSLLIEAGIADLWVLDDVRERVRERKDAMFRRPASSEGVNGVGREGEASA
jgi:hypothetical protein